jgi:broad specificity phosphatase PhoE
VLPNQTFLSDARLREVSKGARQGFPKSWTYEQALEARKQNEQDTPLLETAQDAWQRIFNWMYEVILQSESEANKSDNEDSKQEEEIRKVLVISHAGALRLLLHRLVPDGHPALKMADDPSRPPDDSKRFAVPNTSLTIIDVTLREDAPAKQQQSGDAIPNTPNIEAPEPEEHHHLWTTHLVELTWTGHYESPIIG